MNKGKKIAQNITLGNSVFHCSLKAIKTYQTKYPQIREKMFVKIIKFIVFWGLNSFLYSSKNKGMVATKQRNDRNVVNVFSGRVVRKAERAIKTPITARIFSFSLMNFVRVSFSGSVVCVCWLSISFIQYFESVRVTINIVTLAEVILFPHLIFKTDCRF
jgi:hypothetical protein